MSDYGWDLVLNYPMPEPQQFLANYSTVLLSGGDSLWMESLGAIKTEPELS
jgi:hypothetical protein